VHPGRPAEMPNSIVGANKGLRCSKTNLQKKTTINQQKNNLKHQNAKTKEKARLINGLEVFAKLCQHKKKTG